MARFCFRENTELESFHDRISEPEMMPSVGSPTLWDCCQFLSTTLRTGAWIRLEGVYQGVFLGGTVNGRLVPVRDRYSSLRISNARKEASDARLKEGDIVTRSRRPRSEFLPSSHKIPHRSEAQGLFGRLRIGNEEPLSREPPRHPELVDNCNC
jgi:hypothetical protein